jgi:hypothetical protein
MLSLRKDLSDDEPSPDVECDPGYAGVPGAELWRAGAVCGVQQTRKHSHR